MIATFVNLPVGSCDPGSITISPQLSIPQQMTFDAAGNLLIPIPGWAWSEALLPMGSLRLSRAIVAEVPSAATAAPRSRRRCKPQCGSH
jgi:hypothetical protein